MEIRKIAGRTAFALLVVVLGTGAWYMWQAFPIISGYGAKNLASAVYLQHRNPIQVIKEDLGDFPLSIGSFTVNSEDSSVTGSVWGLAKRKAIYRKGLGCTLINDFTETEIRAQQIELPAAPQINSDTIPWPYGDRVSDTIPTAINKTLLDNAINFAMHAASNGESSYTRAVLVVYDGKIVGEQYADGFGKNTLMLGWSMAKSLTGAMIGILVKEGKIDPDAPAPVPEWKHTKKENITVKQLMQQTSGLDFKEDYKGPSSVTNMLFKRGDMARFTAKLPLLFQPGTVFNYTGGNTNILSRIIRQTLGEKEYQAFPYQSLFHPINAYSFLLEPDASGTYVTSSYSYATARDFARFGLLYYNNGIWNGKQVLPENWVKESIQPATADPLKRYGYQFWLNGLDKHDSTKRWYPDVPADMYFADGYGGQNVYIIPSKKLVVVRLGLHVINENEFLKEIIQAVNP
ncbi:serine hydrolase domain-containing protein [Flavihumibacter fluvii]|uniref:serine hydrolase domain-containing protein n=1 Tax=Flavihumibacter fluvii TaxID=2838157 RepID=UPI001BDE39C6|nr:serine hydrolase [Flavihumibacter fluvii]ULQ54691.1 beta-lactamase family protein [Flavihumibacter fluvii]